MLFARVLGIICLAVSLLPGQDIRFGIIGTDTSHVTAFAAILHNTDNPDHVPGGKIVAAFKGGSQDIPSSASRVEGYAKEIQDKYGVRIVDRIGDLCPMVDALLLLSVDGRKHLPQMREAIACRKPVFIDKPYASSWADAQEIRRIAKEAGVPWFSSSSLRYASFVTELAGKATRGAISWGPGPLEEHHELDLGWYAVHPIEVLFTIMGPGCEKVSRISGPHGEVITGHWKDGRVGTVRTLLPSGGYGAVVFGDKEVWQSPASTRFSYAPTVQAVLDLVKTKQPPVDNDVTMEIFAFMEAANRSRQSGGALQELPRW
jgi:hypothetical protein